MEAKMEFVRHTQSSRSRWLWTLGVFRHICSFVKKGNNMTIQRQRVGKAEMRHDYKFAGL